MTAPDQHRARAAANPEGSWIDPFAAIDAGMDYEHEAARRTGVNGVPLGNPTPTRDTRSMRNDLLIVVDRDGTAVSFSIPRQALAAWAESEPGTPAPAGTSSSLDAAARGPVAAEMRARFMETLRECLAASPDETRAALMAGIGASIACGDQVTKIKVFRNTAEMRENLVGGPRLH